MQTNVQHYHVRTTEKTNLLRVVLNSKLKFDDRVSSICCKVSAQINALNRLKNILPLKSHGDILQPRNGMNYQMTLE